MKKNNWTPASLTKVYHIVFTFAMGAMLLTGCGKDNDGIVGKWQWTGSTMRYVNDYMGQDTTINNVAPLFKDLTFYENGKVDVQQQGFHFPEDEPPYFTYQYNYSLNAAADTVYLTDPLHEYDSQTWKINALTKENLVVEWTEVYGDYAGADVFTYTTTYRRR